MNEYTVIINKDIVIKKVHAINFHDAYFQALQKIYKLRTLSFEQFHVTTVQTK